MPSNLPAVNEVWMIDAANAYDCEAVLVLEIGEQYNPPHGVTLIRVRRLELLIDRWAKNEPLWVNLGCFLCPREPRFLTEDEQVEMVARVLKNDHD